MVYDEIELHMIKPPHPLKRFKTKPHCTCKFMLTKHILTYLCTFCKDMHDQCRNNTYNSTFNKT